MLSTKRQKLRYEIAFLNGMAVSALPNKLFILLRCFHPMNILLKVLKFNIPYDKSRNISFNLILNHTSSNYQKNASFFWSIWGYIELNFMIQTYTYIISPKEYIQKGNRMKHDQKNG